MNANSPRLAVFRIGHTGLNSPYTAADLLSTIRSLSSDFANTQALHTLE